MDSMRFPKETIWPVIMLTFYCLVLQGYLGSDRASPDRPVSVLPGGSCSGVFEV